MGGFMFNGCGAADSYYLLKSLPGHPCELCGKKDYALMELKRKIRVFYIPTVPINTKYGIVCPKCKRGYYVSEAQKDYILKNDPSCVEVVSDGVIIHGFANSLANNTEEIEETDAVAEVEESPQQEKKGAFCSQCGAELAPNAIFCVQCGARINESVPTPPAKEEMLPAEKTAEKAAEKAVTAPALEKNREDNVGVTANAGHEESTTVSNLSSASEAFMYNYQRGKVCPDCGMRFAPGKERCSICGAKL